MLLTKNRCAVKFSLIYISHEQNVTGIDFWMVYVRISYFIENFLFTEKRKKSTSSYT